MKNTSLKLFLTSSALLLIFFLSVNSVFALDLKSKTSTVKLQNMVSLNTSWVNYKGSFTNNGYIANQNFQNTLLLEDRLTSSPSEFLNSQGVVYENILYFTKAFKSEYPCTYGKVYAYDIVARSYLWEVGSCEANYIESFTGTVIAPTVAFNKILLVNSMTQSLTALNSSDGSLAWKTDPAQIGNIVAAPVQQANNIVIVTYQSGKLRIQQLNPADGSVRRVINLNQSYGYNTAFQISVKGNDLYFVSNDSSTSTTQLVRLSMLSGQTYWKYQLDSFDASANTPVLTPYGVLVATKKSYIHINYDGSLRWIYTLNSEESYANGISTNQNSDNPIRLTSANPNGIAVAQYYQNSKGAPGTYLIGFDLNSGNILYNNYIAEKGTTSGATPINIQNNATLIITQSGQLKVFNTESGELITQESDPLLHTISYTQFAPIVVNNKVLVITQQDILIYSLLEL